MRLPVFIGLRYTGASHDSKLLSFFSGVSVFGLVLGVGLLVAVLSIMNGFEREVREEILGLVPQGAIYQREGLDHWQELQATLERNERIVAAAPFVKLQGLVSSRGVAEPVVLYGVAPKQELRVSRISKFLPESTLMQLNQKEPQMILGGTIADRLKLQEGDQVMLIVPSANANSTPKVQYFKLLKILHTQTELDSSLAITHLSNAAALTLEKEQVTGIRLKVSDLFAARDIVWEEVVNLGYGYYGTSWMNTHGNLYQSIQMSKKLVAILMSLIVAIATFNVVSTLVMVVVEKQGDIAILRTMGSSTGDIMLIFIVQGSMIGIIGTGLGLLFGVGLALVVESGVRFFEQAFGLQFLKSDVYPITYLPTEISLSDIVQVGLTALVMSFLATLYPAWKAGRSQPADILRYE